MAMKRLYIVAAAISLVAASLTTGVIWVDSQENQDPPCTLYTYPVSVAEKTYSITVETNWGTAPRISLSNTSLSEEHYVSLDFFDGSSKKSVYYNITIPIGLLWGNISLIWKYYVQSTDRYTLSNNGTCNSVQMTFEYEPYFSGMGHFEVHGTEGIW